MKYTEVLYLIEKNQITDEIGNISYSNKFVEHKTYAKMQKVGTNEFYNAISVGIIPTYEFIIRLSNFNNETEAKYNNEIFSIIRTIPMHKTNEIVLVLGKKTGVNND